MGVHPIVGCLRMMARTAHLARYKQSCQMQPAAYNLQPTAFVAGVQQPCSASQRQRWRSSSSFLQRPLCAAGPPGIFGDPAAGCAALPACHG